MYSLCYVMLCTVILCYMLYPTDLLAFQPVFSSCSNIEHMLQIGTLKAMQMYFVGSEHTEHISSLDFVNVAAMTKKSELWVQPCFKNITIIYALDTAHEKYGV